MILFQVSETMSSGEMQESRLKLAPPTQPAAVTSDAGQRIVAAELSQWTPRQVSQTTAELPLKEDTTGTGGNSCVLEGGREGGREKAPVRRTAVLEHVC